MYDILQLNEMILPELQDIAKTLKIKAFIKQEKQDLVLVFSMRKQKKGNPL